MDSASARTALPTASQTHLTDLSTSFQTGYLDASQTAPEPIPQPVQHSLVTAPPSLPSADKFMVTVLWGFQEFRDWAPSDISKFYRSLVVHLVRENPSLQPSDVNATAYGFCDAFGGSVLESLQNMGVKVELLSNVTPEAVGSLHWEIERAASAVVKNGEQLTTEFVLVTNKAEFGRIVRQLENRDIKTMVVHSSEPDSPIEQRFSLNASVVIPVSNIYAAPPQAATPQRDSSESHVAAASSSVDTPPGARHVGTLDRWIRDKGGHWYGYVSIGTALLPHTSVFLHSKMVIHGTAGVGKSVSLRVEPNPNNQSQTQSYDAVVLESGDCVGIIVKWGMKDKRGATYGFVSVRDGDMNNCDFLAEADIASCIGPGVSVGMEVVFTRVQSTTTADSWLAKNAKVLLTRKLKLSGAVPPPSTEAPPPYADLPRVTILWDFDEFHSAGWSAADMKALYLALVDVLIGDDARLQKKRISATAFGTNIASCGVDVAKNLRDLLIEVATASNCVELVSTGVAKNPMQQSTEVVIISSNKGFAAAVQRLEGRGIKVLVVHGAQRGSPHERGLSLAPSKALHLDDVLPPSDRTLRPLAPTQRPPRQEGYILMWTPHRNSGTISASAGDLNFTDDVVLHGVTKLLRGCRVSFRVSVGGARKPYDVVMLEDGENIGDVLRWGSKDRHGMPYGFVNVAGCPNNHYVALNDVIEGTPSEGDEMVFRVAQSVVRPGTTQAKGAVVLKSFVQAASPLAASTAPKPPHAAPQPPRLPRRSGTVPQWFTDKGGKRYGFIEIPGINATVFVHAATVVHGALTNGCKVSFRSEASTNNPQRTQAFDVVIVGPDEVVATVTSWGMRDKNGVTYGFATNPTSAGKDIFVSSANVVGSVSIGDELVLTAVPSPTTANSTVARNALKLCSRVDK